MHPIYPAACTDDELYIASNPNCTALLWPKHLVRSDSPPFAVLPLANQEYYTPNPAYGGYYGIFAKGESLSGLETASLPDSTPVYPYAATGSLQYVQQFVFSFNTSHNATVDVRCTSVLAETTRGRLLDGLFGRASAPVLIAQPRRKRPGWDGCRDRFDERTDLPAGLQYLRPLPRKDHRAVFNPATQEIFMYGGIGYLAEEPPTFETSYATTTRSDMWYYNINICNNNCSFNGDCYYGFCICRSGYYGIDCSNVTCPGTSCFYDDFSSAETCYHGCQAGYSHTDSDVYVQDISKLPCSSDMPGESNGVCDGFGNAMCAPPFIGSDCSIKDCPDDCSFNGWCSVEYPVSRCMCHPGFFGVSCQFNVCLNNCSYPNGKVDNP